MYCFERIAKKSDSLIDILIAQCTDLEELLALSRSETGAAERGDFEEVLQIVTRRDEIGRRLETAQQQVAELRGFLSAEQFANPRYGAIASRMIDTAGLTLAQDEKTNLLLTASRYEAAGKLQEINLTDRQRNAYVPDLTKGLAYNRDV